MYLTALLPILCLASSISSLAVSGGVEVAGQQTPEKRGDSWEIPGSTGSGIIEDPDVVKLDDTKVGEEGTYIGTPANTNEGGDKMQDGIKVDSWPIIAGPGPAIVDPEKFPALEPVRKGRKNRRSVTASKNEPLPDTLNVPAEQVTQWMTELDDIFAEGSLAAKRDSIDGSPSKGIQSRNTDVLDNIKRRETREFATAWFSLGGGSPNDFRLIFDPSRSGPINNYVDPGDMSASGKRLNYKRDGTAPPIIDKRSKAIAEILAALHDQDDPNGTGTGDHETLNRRSLVDAVSTPVDAKPVQDEVIRRIFKLYGKNNKRDLLPRQPSQEMTQQILQTLFRFEDDEEWKWNAPVLAHRRWSKFPAIEEFSEGSPEKRNHESGGSISTDDIDGRISAGRDPSSYAWPDISLKVREALPKEADEASQRIIVTIFRMQENFRHKRSIIEAEQEVKEVLIERRGVNVSYGWFGNFFDRARSIRPWRWLEEHMQHNHQRDIQAPEAKLQRHSIDRHSQDESQMTKRDVASDLLAWMEKINNYLEENRNGTPPSDGQPTVAYVSAGPEEKPADGYRSGGAVAPTKRDAISKGISGIFDSIKLALPCNKVLVPNPPTTVLMKRKPQPQGGDRQKRGGTPTSRLKKRYDPELYPWWSGGSKNNGEDNPENPWTGGNSCARLRFANGCAGSYKRSLGNARNRLQNLRKRIAQDEKKQAGRTPNI
ncbi:uncharacterized protein DFL_007585 [Arthrobotrys flagrans]|uniref:HTH CENPB-type domain-containing protein n=1 Tax=Arthrobotrys flagrans TaxID=97331 RepID=A0A436ZWR6_ARTFL|nr:hypothetical protein DFL_007585 [Arthrobotrys flagrans]